MRALVDCFVRGSAISPHFPEHQIRHLQFCSSAISRQDLQYKRLMAICQLKQGYNPQELDRWLEENRDQRIYERTLQSLSNRKNTLQDIQFAGSNADLIIAIFVLGVKRIFILILSSLTYPTKKSFIFFGIARIIILLSLYRSIGKPLSLYFKQSHFLEEIDTQMKEGI